MAACLLRSAVGLASPLEDVQTCLESNIPQSSSALTVDLRSRDRSGSTHLHEARLYWKRFDHELSKMVLCMASPRDVRGLTYVLHYDSSGYALWIYVPQEGRVVRIEPGEAARRGHIGRTAISYQDIRYLPLNLTAAVQRRDPDAVLDGRTVSVVRLSLSSQVGSGYDQVALSVDPESCVPLRTDFYGPGDELLKTARADPDSLQSESGIRIARSVLIRDLERDVETELRVRDVTIDSDLPDRLFDPGSQRGICRR